MAEAATQERIYVLEVDDRPGVLSTVAAAFANRGLSIQALATENTGRERRMLVAFSGTARQCRLIGQVLSRLHNVRSVVERTADSPELLAMAVCSAEGEPPALPEGVSLQEREGSWLFAGTYAAVGRVIAELQEKGLAKDVSRSLAAR